MSHNGKVMRLSFVKYLVFAFLIVLGPSKQSLAGNRWMMKKNGNELIMFNSMLLKRLGTNLKDGEIILSGDVVHEDGNVIIKLYKLQQIHTSTGEEALAPEVFDKDLPYHIFLREETLSEIPTPDAEQNERKSNNN